LESLASAALFPWCCGCLPQALHRRPAAGIRLHDLIMDETARSKERLAAEIPVDNRSTDSAEFKRRLIACESSTEILRHLFFHGGVWAQPENFELFLRPQQMIVPRGTAAGFLLWIELQRSGRAAHLCGWPGAIAAGIRALRDLLSLTFEHQGRERTALQSLSYSVTNAQNLPESLYPDRRYTPMSDHLADCSSPWQLHMSPILRCCSTGSRL